MKKSAYKKNTKGKYIEDYLPKKLIVKAGNRKIRHEKISKDYE